jgi:hypothetical protein
MSGLEDKLGEQEHSDKDKKKRIRKYKWNIQELRGTIKRPSL